MFDADMIFRIPALLIALTVHEYAHAKAADSLGDPTPRYLGRLTLNPLAHLDPVGLLMLWLFKFGWAKPVPINPSYFRDGRRGIFLVSLAGPVSNIALAFLTWLGISIMYKLGIVPGIFVMKTLYLLFAYNIILAIFNLVPIPPLDGAKVLQSLLPGRQAYAFSRLEVYGPFILIALIYLDIIRMVTYPLEMGLSQIIQAIVALVV